MRAGVWAIVSVLSLLAGIASAQQMDLRIPSEKPFPGFNSLDIGNGRALRYMCRGVGAPTVIVEQAAGVSVETVFSWGLNRGWPYIVPKVEKSAKICVYDRAGLGHSSALTQSRSSVDAAHDLHSLLDKAGIAPPYVLVGHSLGGINARAFASEYPDAVRGMVLIDSSSPDQLQRFEKVLPPRSTDESDFIKGLRDGPNQAASGGEWYDFKAIAALTSSLQPLGDKPLIVLSRDPNRIEPIPIPREWQEAINRESQAMQAELVKLSTRGKQIVLSKAGHQIPAEQPQVVVDAILDVLKQTRKAAKR